MIKVAFAVAVIISLIWVGENSICRSVSCFRELVSEGQTVCFVDMDSAPILISDDNFLSKLYFVVRDLIWPTEHTVVWNEERKVIALLEPGDLFPLQKDPPHGESCVTVQ